MPTEPTFSFEDYDQAVLSFAEAKDAADDSQVFADSLRGLPDAEACVSFRQAVATAEELERMAGYCTLNLFSWEQGDRQKAWWLFYFDLTYASIERGLEKFCRQYATDQPLFIGAPRLFEAIRRRNDSESSDLELIADRVLTCICDSEVYRAGAGYTKLAPMLHPRIPVWARAKFPDAPLYLRMDPDVFEAEQPPIVLTEAAIVPADPRWMSTLGLFPNTRRFAAYELQQRTAGENASEYVEYRLHDLRRLEIAAVRREPDYLSMIIEELPRADDPSGLMVGRCIHLDTRAAAGTPMAEATLEHLDLAINVYRGADRAARMTKTLQNGKCQDATFRTHLIRIENIPFPATFVFAQMFLRSQILFHEMVMGLGVAPPSQ